MSRESKPSVVLAHGLWADGSCYSKVIPALIEDGHDVVSTQNSLDSLEGDVAAVKRALGQVKSPAILVVTCAEEQSSQRLEPTTALWVWSILSALAPDDDETSQSLQEKFPKTDVLDHIEVTEGRIWLKQGIGYFCGDLSAGGAAARLGHPGRPCCGPVQSEISWCRLEVEAVHVYIVGTEDHTVNPELERFVAKRMGATTYEVASSHVAMLSNPDVVIEAILKLAASV